MATRKTPASKTISNLESSVTSRGKKSSRGRKSTERRIADLIGVRGGRSAARFDVAKYVVPGVLATGALMAAGYGLKEQLGDIASGVLKAAAKQGTKATKAAMGVSDSASDAASKVTDALSIESILKYAGLQKRSTMMSILSPTIGALCGFVAGAAVTFLVGPKLLEQFSEGAGKASTSPTAPDAGRNSAAVDGESPMNGGLHRGIS